MVFPYFTLYSIVEAHFLGKKDITGYMPGALEGAN